MEQKNEIIDSIGIATEKGKIMISNAKDFISVMEVLITSANSLKSVLAEKAGGENHE